MLNILFSLPAPFWLVAALLVGGGFWSVRRFGDGTGLPTLAVLGTVAAWYVGDAFYNDYPNNHAILFDSGILWGAWFQVAWFLIVFLLAVPEAHQRINGRLPNQRSGVMQLFSRGVDFPVIQEQMREIFWFCAGIWGLVFLLALVTLKGEVIYFLFPFLGYQASPWSHGRIGTGFDALSVLGFYLHLLSCTMFGVVAALATDRRVRWFAITLCLFAWPYFIFDRTRNTMLAMFIPAVLSWVFLRMRGGLLKKGIVLLVCFMLVNGWMKFIIANRSEMSIGQALKSLGSGEAKKEAHNAGLNMFEELCWISKFIDQGTYHVNWGQRYFAELVNPIPRGIWHGKPLIGIDYAIARGQGGGEADQAGVTATVSTGLIGQGVVNFGRVLGPAAAAILMALWVAWLARLDLEILRLWHLPLYSLGLILTFNLGRDITLITIYTFLFGLLLARWLERRRLQKGIPPAPKVVRQPATVRVQPLAPARNTFVRRVQSSFVKRSVPKNSGSKPSA